jgi:coproporphyrinogen III oxidase-like Fe-S oxidoreductase
MGITAISGIQNAYAQNQRDIPSWEKAVNERGIATMRGYHLSDDDRLRRTVISRLLCHTIVLKDEIARAPLLQDSLTARKEESCHSEGSEESAFSFSRLATPAPSNRRRATLLCP